MSQTLLPATCCCAAFDFEIDASIGDALKGDSRTQVDTQVDWADRETAWATLQSAAVGALAETDTLGELSIGRYVAGSWMYYDLDHIDLQLDAVYRTKVPLTFDTSVLDGLTITRAIVRITALWPDGAGEAGCLTEHFAFGLFDAGGTQHDGNRNTATPDVTGFFEIELTDPDTLLNKTGDTVLQLRFLSNVNAALPAGHTFDGYAAYSPGGLGPTGWTYAQAWLMDSGLTSQVQLLVEVA